MTTYWILFLYPLFGIVAQSHLSATFARLAWWVLAGLWILTIGFRIEVGCDWDGYLWIYNNFHTYGNFGDLTVNGFWFTLFNWDPGYIAITWASARMGLGIYGVNVACGALIVFGLATFCTKMPSPWLAWLVATPYLLTVISMGYSRQAVALGFFFWALSFLFEKKQAPFILLTLIGVTFHKATIFFLPFGILSWLTTFRLRTLFIFVLLLAPITIAMLAFTKSYLLVDNYSSAGAPVRALMNALPAALLLLLYKRWRSFYGDSLTWVWLACASIVSILVVVWPISTAIDRIGLYLLPIQVYVWSRLPSLPMFSSKGLSQLVTGVIVLLYGLAHFVWLNFALHKQCWVPYRNLLLDLLHFSL